MIVLTWRLILGRLHGRSDVVHASIQSINLELTDKTALVSGSTKGIGFAIATGLAREGARVIVNGRSEKAVVEAKGQICRAVSEAQVETFAGDLSTAAATEGLV